MHGTRTCSVEDCGRSKIVAYGLCGMHYKRWRRHGIPTGRRHVLTEDERFLPHVAPGPVPETRPGLGECHVWTGIQAASGYGYMTSPGRAPHRLAHRVSYERSFGPIPAGMVIDHLCRNRICVNPAHLEAVTNEENLRRGKGYRLRNGMDSSCINGHRYTPENTYVNRNDPSDRRCRACQRNRTNREKAA